MCGAERNYTRAGARWNALKSYLYLMFYTYVLRSLKDQRFYIGFTADLRARLEQHNDGTVNSTKHRRPLKLIYFEACLCKEDAMNREKYFKTHYGRMFLKKRLAGFLDNDNAAPG